MSNLCSHVQYARNVLGGCALQQRAVPVPLNLCLAHFWGDTPQKQRSTVTPKHSSVLRKRGS